MALKVTNTAPPAGANGDYMNMIFVIFISGMLVAGALIEMGVL